VTARPSGPGTGNIVECRVPHDTHPDFIGAFVAMTADGVIGLDGDLPWHYSEDLKRFKRHTLDSNIVMGRLTWESVGGKPLPRRRNMVVTSRKIDGVECYPSIEAAIDDRDGPVWIIGGGQIYTASLQLCHVLDVTWVPDRVDDPSAVRFPRINPARWLAGPRRPMPEDERLHTQRFYRRVSR